MIIACPACATRYAVPDSTIGIDGRTVRCAKCRHAWFQEGPREPELAMPEPVRQVVSTAQMTRAAEARPAPPPSAPPAPAPATTVVPPPPASPPISSPPVSPPAPEPVSAQFHPEPPLHHEAPRAPRVHVDEPGDTGRDDGPSRFAYEPPFRPRRNPARLWTAAAIGFAVVVCAVIAAVAWYGLPDWVPLARSTFAAPQPDLKLDFPPNRQERRPLPNGTDFFNVSGTITNLSQQRRAVPVLLIVLRDKRNRIVYGVEAAPARGMLAPGESEAVNQAIIDAPKSARTAEIGWKPE